MYSIGLFFCRDIGSQTFNVYVDKVVVSSYFSKCHKRVKLYFSSTGRSGGKFCTNLRLGKLHVPVESWLDICIIKRSE